MQNKKSRIIIVMAVIVIISVVAITAALVLLGTDVTKSNKEVFFKHAMSFTEDEQLSNIEKYYEKQLNTPFESTITYYTNITDKGENILSKEDQEVLNNTKINIHGKYDLANQLAEAEASIDFNEDIKFPVLFKATEELMGFKSDLVVNKYVATKNNIKELMSNEDIDVETLKQKIEEFKAILNDNSKSYINAIMNSVDDRKFSKYEENGEKGYIATLNIYDIRDMSKAALQVLKYDEQLKSKANEIVDLLDHSENDENKELITTEFIDSYIEYLDENIKEANEANTNEFIEEDAEDAGNEELITDTYEENNNSVENKEIIIKVQIEKNKPVAIVFEYDNSQVLFSKDKTKNEYEISLKTDDTQISLKAVFNGLEDMNSVNENYILNTDVIEDGIEIIQSYSLSRNVSFIEGLEINGFEDDEAVNIDNYDENQRDSLKNSIMDKIEQVNKDQLQQLGAKEETLIIYELPFMSTMDLIINKYVGATTSMVESAEKQAFNSKFEAYAGDNVKGSQVNALIQAVKSNNEIEENHKIGITAQVNNWNYDTNLASSQSNYKVTYEKDENGYINKIKIEDSEF